MASAPSARAGGHRGDDPPHSNRRGRRIYIKDSVLRGLELGALLWSIDGSYYAGHAPRRCPHFRSSRTNRGNTTAVSPDPMTQTA